MRFIYQVPYLLAQIGKVKYQIIKTMYTTDQVTYIKVVYNSVNYALGIYKASKDSKRRFEIHEKIKHIDNTMRIEICMYDHDIEFDYLKSYKADIGLFKFCTWPTLSHTLFNPDKAELLNTAELIKLRKFFMKLMHTVGRLHKMNIYHLDLKPENVLCENEDAFAIIDFGTALEINNLRSQEYDALINRTEKVGHILESTEEFSSLVHDRVAQINVLTEKYDVYSLGCTLYNLLTGKYLGDSMKLSYANYEFLYRNYGLVVADLVYNMTHPDAALRYTTEAVLSHPYFHTSSDVFSNEPNQIEDNHAHMATFHFNYLSSKYNNMKKLHDKFLSNVRSSSTSFREIKFQLIIVDPIKDDENKTILFLSKQIRSNYNTLQFTKLDEQQLLRMQKNQREFYSCNKEHIVFRISYYLRRSLMINVFLQFWQLRTLALYENNETGKIVNSTMGSRQNTESSSVHIVNSPVALKDFKEKLETVASSKSKFEEFSSSDALRDEPEELVARARKETSIQPVQEEEQRVGILKTSTFCMNALDICRLDSVDLFEDEFEDLLERQATLCATDITDLNKLMSDV